MILQEKMKRDFNGECINANVDLFRNWGTSKLTTDDSITRHYCNGPRKENYELSLALNCVTKCIRYEEELNGAIAGHKFESISICAEIHYASNEKMSDFEIDNASLQSRIELTKGLIEAAQDAHKCYNLRLKDLEREKEDWKKANNVPVRRSMRLKMKKSIIGIQHL